MRGALLIVSPPDLVAEAIRRLAIEWGCIVVEANADEITRVVTIEVDPLGEVRADGIAIADHDPAPER